MNNSQVFTTSRLAKGSISDQPLVLPWLLERLSPVLEDKNLVYELSKEFTISEFELGEGISNLSDLSGHPTQEEFEAQNFYLICQGKVRLLGFNPAKQRQTSIQLLPEGETFGGDSYYCKAALPYQAIAASKAKIARIPLNKLKPWLKKFPKPLQ